MSRIKDGLDIAHLDGHNLAMGAKKKPTSTAAPRSQSLTVILGEDEARWVRRESSKRALAEDRRVTMSDVVRELIRRAAGLE